MSYESRLETLSKKAMRQLDAIGVDYMAPVDWKLSNATSSFGTTRRVRNVVTGKLEFHIRISRMTLDESVPDDRAMDTIIHELIHTVPGCFNHGEEFKKMATLVNDCYACYNISRTSTYEEAGLTKEAVSKYKKPQKVYFVQCCGCGDVFTYHKETKLVRILATHGNKAKTNYRCRCGCNTFVLF